MPNPINRAKNKIDDPFLGLKAALIDPIFLRPPLLDKRSAWFGHTPFARWLIRFSAPEVLVELGTHAGVSYSAFCASVLHEKLTTQCYAVDTWKGDQQAGFYPEQTYSDLSLYHEKHYSSFSTLLRMTFDDAVERFADGSIDLLHIDGFHSYEAVRHDFHTWKSKLSDRAIVLFHDTNERSEGYGVWRFWNEVKQDYPNFEFLHSHGLGVLCVGTSAPKPLLQLCGLSNDDKERLQTRFELIGHRWVVESQLRRLSAESVQTIGSLNNEVSSLISKNSELEVKDKLQQNERVKLLNQLAECHTRTGKLENDMKVASEEFRKLQQVHSAVLSSNSWRITAPLRRILIWLRFNR